MNPIRQFEIALEIARQGSISRAAESFRLAQPTLSKYLSNLEGELGCLLFDRSTLPLKPTLAGEKYLTAGRRIVDVYYQMNKELQVLKEDRNSVITIGMSPTRAAYMLPTIIAEFRKTNANTKVIVSERTTKQLNDELIRGDLDLIISLFSDTTRQFEKVELSTEEVLLAVPTAIENLDVIEILKTVPIISTASYLRLGQLLSDVVAEVKAPAPMVEIQSIESSLAMVRAGLGIMLVPSYIAQNNINSSLRFKELPISIKNKMRLELKRSVCIFYRKEQYLTETEKNFIMACKNVIQ